MNKKRLIRIAKWTGGIILAIFLFVTATLYIFKDEICGLAIAEVNKHLKSKVSVGNVDLSFWGSFPKLSIDFEEVFIPDSYPEATSEDTLLYTERIRCKFNPIDLWNENYSIESVEINPGNLNLKVNHKGEVNYDIFKESNDSISSAFEIKLNEVELNELKFSYKNSVTKQLYSSLLDKVVLNGAFDEKEFKLDALCNLSRLTAQSGKVSLIKNQRAHINIGIQVNNELKTVKIPNSVIQIAGLPFLFKGDIDSSEYKLSLSAKSVQIQDVANSFTTSQSEDVKRFSGNGNLLFNLNIEGKKSTFSPVLIACDFGIKNGSLIDPSSSIKISQIEVNGKYSNHGGTKKEFLALNTFQFNTSVGQFNGDLTLTNFAAPLYKGSAKGKIDLHVLNELIKLEQLQRLDGLIDVNTVFVVQSKNDEKGNTQFDIERCDGEMVINNTNIQFKDDKRLFEDINGTSYFRNNEIGLDKIQLRIGSSDFKINGVFRDLSAYLSGSGKLQADVEIASKNIDMSDLGSDTKEEKIDNERQFILPNDISGSVYLDVRKLKYDTHVFSQIAGNMSVSERLIHFPRIAVTSGGAEASGTLTIEERRPEIFYISSQLASKNIDFIKLFNEWDDFNQDVITAKNISGRAQANIKFEAPFDFRNGIISNAIRAQIGIQIDEGRLKNVEAFRSITESLKTSASARLAIGKNNINEFERKLLNLEFEQLVNTIVIKNSMITIPVMSIKSNALDLETSGSHTFDNKIDYRFGFRFRDLKQKETSEFGEIEDDKSGKYIFMRMYGDLDNPIIEWDKVSSREMRKQNNEEELSTAKSILKSEFGLFKNDSTVDNYIQPKRQHETLEIEFNPSKEIDPLLENTKPKKDTKASKLLNKWKEEAKEGKKETFEIDDDF